jgi:hypothetical protein
MDNTETRTLNRSGAMCAGLGAVVTGVSWVIHPELTDPAGYLPIVAGSSHFVGTRVGAKEGR